MKKFEILRHSANRNMIRIQGLQIREAPKCEGGGYYLIGDVAEYVVAVLLAYENKKLLDNLTLLSELQESSKRDNKNA